MAARPTPAQFDALVPDPNAPACDQLRAYLQMTRLYADWVSWHYGPDGLPTQDFINLICATGCAGGGTSDSSSTSSGGGSSTAYLSSRFFSGGAYRGRFFTVNTDSWTYSTVAGNMDEIILAMAVHPSTGVVWVIYENQTATADPFPVKLGTINTTTGVVTSVATLNASGSDIEDSGGLFYPGRVALAIRADGTFFYTYSDATQFTGAGRLYTVNPATAELTNVGTTMTMDSTSNRFTATSMSFDSGGALIAVGQNDWLGPILTVTINTTPNPSFSNQIVCTQECELLAAAATQNIYSGLAIRGSAKYYSYTPIGDLYQGVSTTGSCSTVAKMTAPASMAGVLAFTNKAT